MRSGGIDTVGSGPDRERIRRALFDLTYEHGYPQVTLAALLERAEVESGAFRREFGDLEDCFCEVLEEETAQLLAAAWKGFVEESSWCDQVRAVAYTLFHFLGEDEARANMMIVEVDLAGERARLIRDQGMQAFITFIDMGREELDDPASISRTTAEAIGGAVFSQMKNEVERGDSASRSSLVPKLMYAVVLPYLGLEAARRELHALPPATPV